MNKTAIAAAVLVGAIALTGCADTSDDDNTNCTTITTAGFTPPRPAPPAPKPIAPKPVAPKPAQPKVRPGLPTQPNTPHGPRTHVVCSETETANA
ncbi:hypothetical protein ACWGJW_02570 [Streptomyces nigrescens]